MSKTENDLSPSETTDAVPAPLPPPTPAQLEELRARAAKADENWDRLLRSTADFDNFKKRAAREKIEAAQYASFSLLQKLLPVLDTLDLAEAHLAPGAAAEPSPESKALSQVRTQLLDVLGADGLERVDAAEVVFDPVVHDAVAHFPLPGNDDDLTADATDDGGSEDDDGRGSGAAGPAGAVETVVDEVLRSGYRWRGQVLRPAMVRVRG